MKSHILFIGGMILVSVGLLMLLPLASMGNTTNLSIMQALNPSNNNSTAEAACDDPNGNSLDYDFEEYVKIGKGGKLSNSVKDDLASTEFKNMSGFNEYAKEQVNKAGYGTANGVVAFAMVMAGDYIKYTDHKLRYAMDSGKNKGPVPKQKDTTEGLVNDRFFMDCSEFAWWALYNGGFKLPTDSSVAEIDSWAKKNKYNKDIKSGNIGDFILHYKNDGYHHIQLIVGAHDNGYYTAEESGGYPKGYAMISKHSFDKLKKDGYYVIDMSKYYGDGTNKRAGGSRSTQYGNSLDYDFEDAVKISKSSSRSSGDVNADLSNTSYKSRVGFNKYVSSQVEKTGLGTRNGVVTAAMAYAYDYPKATGKKLRYYSKSGSCGDVEQYPMSDGIAYNHFEGISCNNFVFWAIYNGGFKISKEILYNCGDKSLSHTFKLPAWSNDNGWTKKVKEGVGQPGDILWRFKCKKYEGSKCITYDYAHFRLIVGNYDGGYYVAEATGGNANGSVMVTKRSFEEVKKDHYQITDMSDYYKNASNKRKGSSSAATQANSSDSNTSEECGGDGRILLIAGHSYAPYCKQVENECREESKKDMSSGYFEPDETRSLVKLIKSKLETMGVSADIANELLGGTDSKMNKSFFIESSLNTADFNAVDWTHYDYVLEVHFNASKSRALVGTQLVKSSSDYSTKADKDIVEAVIKHTGNTQLNDSIQPLNDFNYFTKLNIPITYLETEFYDNKAAMDKYSAKKSQIALDIAKAIKNTYGNVSHSSGGKASSVVECARGALGVPYVWGGTDYKNGMDCSGLTSVCYQRALNVDIGRTTWDQLASPHFVKVSSIDKLSPGDLINTGEHVAIYIGNGQIIHEPQTGEVCKIANADWMVSSGATLLHYKG